MNDSGPISAAGADDDGPASESAYRPGFHGVYVMDAVQTVLTALMLAFIFRAFFIEAFIIPTGSMAPGLLGQHVTLVCPACGYEFDCGPGYGELNPRTGFRAPRDAFCPNCHSTIPLTDAHVTEKSGDRILVHKWPLVLGGPLGLRRWDVIVFRDPMNPFQNYIKRLVAFPNESIEIIDGDVYIKAPGDSEFRIARKTAAAQKMLWFPVFDQDYQPTPAVRPDWLPAWVTGSAIELPEEKGGWTGLASRVICYDAADAVERTVTFAPAGSRYFMQDVYGYDHGSGGNYVGDVRLTAEVRVRHGNGRLRWMIVRDGRRFEMILDADGTISVQMSAVDGEMPTVVLGSWKGDPFEWSGRPRRLEFGHLDYRVYVRLDGQEILTTNDLQYAPDVELLRTTRRIVPVRVAMSGHDLRADLQHLRIERDVHYTYSDAKTLRAYAGRPFALEDAEYFVLGDNSPSSADAREWFSAGLHLRDDLRADRYHVGTVRADQIVGQAFFVYLPGLLEIDGPVRFHVPDLGRMRFVR